MAVGRPKRDKRLSIPLRDEEVKRIEHVCYLQDKPVAAWIREILMREVARSEAARKRLRSRRSDLRGGEDILAAHEANVRMLKLLPPVPPKPEEPEGQG